jgi:ribosomal protein S9
VATSQYYGTGRRKTATARVFLRPGKGTVTVNYKPIETCFPGETHRLVIRQALVVTASPARPARCGLVLPARSCATTVSCAPLFGKRDS